MKNGLAVSFLFIALNLVGILALAQERSKEKTPENFKYECNLNQEGEKLFVDLKEGEISWIDRSNPHGFETGIQELLVVESTELREPLYNIYDSLGSRVATFLISSYKGFQFSWSKDYFNWNNEIRPPNQTFDPLPCKEFEDFR